jgi:hypothetical protein
VASSNLWEKTVINENLILIGIKSILLFCWSLNYITLYVLYDSWLNMNWNELGGKWSYSYRAVVLKFACRDWGKPRKILVMIAGVLAGILYEQLPDMGLGNYRSFGFEDKNEQTRMSELTFPHLLLILGCDAIQIHRSLPAIQNNFCLHFQGRIIPGWCEKHEDKCGIWASQREDYNIV